MKKIILWSLFVIVITFIVFAFIKTRPSGNINDFKAYFHHDARPPGNGSVKLTFLGVSTVLLDDGETQLLIDGFFTRPSLLTTLTSKISTNKEVVERNLSAHKMDRVKAVFVTHSHYDHSFDAAYVVRRTHARLYGSLSTLNIGRGEGLREDQMALFEPGKELQLGRFSIVVLESKHSPPKSFNNDLGREISMPIRQPRKAKDYTEGGSYDFLVKHNGHTIYIKPSANYIKDRLAGLNAEVVLLGIGTLGSQNDHFKEQFYQETVGRLKPKLIVPIHWDDFFEPLSEQLEMMPNFFDNTAEGFKFMLQKTRAENIVFKILQGGKSILLFEDNKVAYSNLKCSPRSAKCSF